MQNVVVLAGSGSSIAAGGPSMEKLWDMAVGTSPSKIAQSLGEKVHYDLAQRNVEALLSQIDAYRRVEAGDQEAASFMASAQSIILRACTDFLISGVKLEAHKTFLHRLAKRRVRDPRLRVFTTNYDVCFERAASEIGSVAIDGFSFTAPRAYDPRFFGYDIVRRAKGQDEAGSYLEGVFILYKLHGSATWARTAEGKIVEREPSGESEYCLIFPATGKYQLSYTQPHLEAMAQFMASVREPNTCVIVVGFGFADDHLAEPLLGAAESNPNVRLLVVDPAIQMHIAASRPYWLRLNKLRSQGNDVWLIEADFNRFSQLIPDLKAVSPGDALLRAVRAAQVK